MKVFYTASFHGKEKYQKYYDLILEAIEETGVELYGTEKGNYKEILTEEEKAKLDHPKKVHYEAIKKGIEWADLVIIEISEESFQLGHEATLAIQNKKPVLCLSVNEDFSIKIHNRYFYAAKYTKYFVKDIVKDFIAKHQKELLSDRFNLFLSKRQLANLERKSKEKGMNKSEFLRDLIEKN